MYCVITQNKLLIACLLACQMHKAHQHNSVVGLKIKKSSVCSQQTPALVMTSLSVSTIFHSHYRPISMVHFVSLLIIGQSAQCVLVNRSLGTNQHSVFCWAAHRFCHLLVWFDLLLSFSSAHVERKGRTMYSIASVP